MHIVRKYTNCRDTLKTSQTTFIDFPMYNKKKVGEVIKPFKYTHSNIH